MTSATGFVENFPCLHWEAQGRTRRFRASQIAPFGDLYCKRAMIAEVENRRSSTGAAGAGTTRSAHAGERPERYQWISGGPSKEGLFEGGS
jgi:hypothetical protein